jgi:hypothetical protein
MDDDMLRAKLNRRHLSWLAVSCGSVLATFVLSTSAQAICSSPLAGRWTNLQPGKDPGILDVSFISCGDTNTQPDTSFGVRPWVKQSSGKWYGRPRVKAAFVNSQGKQWLLGKVPTGGYVDHMFLRVENGNLRVFIRHKSLDSKPDATSWHTYKRT